MPAAKKSSAPQGEADPAGRQQEPAEQNFRSRNAMVKREKMRKRLLAATMSVTTDPHRSGPAMIDDVVKAAGVSRGAFYWYFDTLSDAVEELGRELADEFGADAYALFHNEPDPVLRAALGGQMMLHRAAMDIVWARYLGNVHVLLDDSQFVTAVRRNLTLGQEAGKFKFNSVMMASDFQIGALMSAIRRCTLTPIPRFAELAGVNMLILRGLGVSSASARSITDRALSIIESVGPHHLAWWKPSA